MRRLDPDGASLDRYNPTAHWKVELKEADLLESLRQPGRDARPAQPAGHLQRPGPGAGAGGDGRPRPRPHRFSGMRIRGLLGLKDNVFRFIVLGQPPDRRWIIYGRGWGHGVGMDQTGAYGLALEGASYEHDPEALLPGHPASPPSATDGPCPIFRLPPAPGLPGSPAGRIRTACWRWAGTSPRPAAAERLPAGDLPLVRRGLAHPVVVAPGARPHPPRDERLSRRTQRALRRLDFQVRRDTCFAGGDRSAARGVPRPGQGGTWITPEMARAYTALHREGYAHSFEAFRDGRLAGGCTGSRLGAAFFGESMFSLEDYASRAAFAELCRTAWGWGFQFIDGQLPNANLADLGARVVEPGGLPGQAGRGRWSSRPGVAPGGVMTIDIHSVIYHDK